VINGLDFVETVFPCGLDLEIEVDLGIAFDYDRLHGSHPTSGHVKHKPCHNYPQDYVNHQREVRDKNF
jgi:hypothetical protein